MRAWLTQAGGSPPDQQVRTRPFRDGFVVSLPGNRVGAPLFLVRNGQVRPFQLARETADEAFDQLVAEQG